MMSELPAPPRPAVADWRFCVAPMIDVTDRFARYFYRRLSRRARLYTEMINANAILRGDAQRHLRFDPSEHPVALQLGGSEPALLAEAAAAGAEYGYDEINLNCGCPSDRVQEGRFGACLMLDAPRVAACVRAMRDACRVPVTVKCRIGVDDSDGYAFLHQFVQTVHDAGCEVLILHARKAWLQGLSPKENREIPPLDYGMAPRLKQDFPQLQVILNGGLRSLADCDAHAQGLDGVMLGRAPWDDPWLLAGVDAWLDGAAPHATPAFSRREVMLGLRPFIEQERAEGTRLATLTRAALGLWRGQPGGRAFRRVLSENAHRPDAGWEVVEQALAQVDHTWQGAA